MVSVGCLRVRGACIAGKPGSYNPCWSWLACDGFGGMPASARRLHRGQARLLQYLLELACLRWRRWGANEFAASASRARPAPTTAGAVFVGAGLPAMVSVGCQRVRGACIAGRPGSYNPCWSWLACDGFGKPTPTGCAYTLSPYWLNPAIGIILQPLSTSNDCTGKRFARSLEWSLTFQRSGLATREYMQRCPDFDGWRVRRLRRFYGGCAREGFGPAGFPVLTGSPTCVQLPPFRLATIQVVAPVQYRSSS